MRFAISLWCLICATPATCHFLWLKEGAADQAVVTFGETAGVPGSAAMLPMISDKIVLSAHDTKRGPRNLTLTSVNGTAGTGKLVAHLDTVRPFSLGLAATFGAFRGGLLRYWSSADMVNKQHDWPVIDAWAKHQGLYLTLRDPWIKQSSKGVDRPAGPGDQCGTDAPWQNGDACVVALIKFAGQQFGADLNVTTYASDGSKISATHSPSGQTLLKIPYNKSAAFTEVFASVNYREPKSGVYNGQKYAFVDHWATTYARIARSTLEDNTAFTI